MNVWSMELSILFIYPLINKHKNICINEAFARLPRGNASHCVNLQENTVTGGERSGAAAGS